MELVSVIIPMHNAEQFIAETLESVAQQTYPSIEVIVVNGGSTDGSVALVESFNLPNLTLYNRDNLGQASNSNFGISVAKGTLIKFLDADDILAEDCIEKMVNKWCEHPNRLVFGEWHYFVGRLKHVSWNHSEIYRDYQSALDWYVDCNNKAGSMMAAWMWLIPKSILERAGGWDERLTITNDLEFSTRLVLESNGIGFAKGAVHYYRKGSPNAMTSVITLNLPEATAKSVVTGLYKAYENVMKVEDSPRIRLIFANLFQKWVYIMYPKHIFYVKQMESTIKLLGGSSRLPQGGKLYNILVRILPWKVVTRLQLILYKTVWKPILLLKQKRKLKRQFGLDI